MNHELNSQDIPDDLRQADIVPIFKAGDPKEVKNFRPISLIESFWKLLESVFINKVDLSQFYGE